MRLRSLSVPVCGLALVLAALPAFAAAPSNMKPAPKAVGLQYDQIVRMVISPATPPPPGSFSQAYQALIAAEQGQASAQSAPPKHHGLAGLAEAFGNAGAQMEKAAKQMQNMMQYGTLTRIAYYNGWVRTDDVVAQTAVIDKCRQHQAIYLDLGKKTYRIVDTSAKPDVQPCPAPQMPGTPQREVVNEAPGTADLSITSKQQNLGAMTLEGVPTAGSTNTIQMAMTNATGSCKNQSYGMQTTRYVSNITPPRRYCPLPKIENVPTTPEDVVVHGGCKPKMTGSMSGAYWMHEGDKLEMYSRMSMISGEGAGRFDAVTQRGNVTWLQKAQADALFSVPAGFTLQQ